VLVRGGEDYEKTDAGCQIARVVPADAPTPEWDWEQGTYVHRAVVDLCGQGYPSRALCQITPRCGDGFCSFDPVDEMCPADCAQGACSDVGCTKSALEVGEPGDPVPPAKAARRAGHCSAHPARREASLAWASGLLAVTALGVRRRRRSR
jgi:hypothetical protein